MELIVIDKAELVQLLHQVIDSKIDRIAATVARIQSEPPKKTMKNILSDYIMKKDVRGKLLSSSTLWKLEKAGRLRTFTISGKRFYKISDLESLIVEVPRGDDISEEE